MLLWRSFLITFACGFIGSLTYANDSTSLQQKLTEALKKDFDPREQALRLHEHQEFRDNNPNEIFSRKQHFTAHKHLPLLRKESAKSAVAIKRILILVNIKLYSNATAKMKIDRYISDIGAAHNCDVELEAISGGTPDSVKTVIKNYYNNGGLDGAIQIGSLPVAWYEFAKDPFSNEYEDFTCDLFYMDLDGTWLDTMSYINGKVVKASNGKYDGHRKGSGDLGPEIFYARIDPSTMSQYGDEITLLSEYLDKTHNFWTGNIAINDTAMFLICHDWYNIENNVSQVYGNSHTAGFRYNTTVSDTVKFDYLNKLKVNYSIVQLWCHANYNVHGFYDGSTYSELYMNDVYKANPKPIAYFHDGCYLSDFAAGGGKAFLGGCYVFNKSPTALVSFGGSRSGQWIGYMGKELFQQLSYNTCLGQAFKIWLSNYQNNTSIGESANQSNFIAWNFGYNIIGDPMLTFVKPNTAPVIEKYTKSSATIKKLLCSYDAMKKNIAVSYTLPQNSNVDLKLYNMSGECIKTIFKKSQTQGMHIVNINTHAYAQGVYMISLQSDSHQASGQISIVQ